MDLLEEFRNEIGYYRYLKSQSPLSEKNKGALGILEKYEDLIDGSAVLDSDYTVLKNQYLEDGDLKDGFDAEGRYSLVVVRKEEFENNKTKSE